MIRKINQKDRAGKSRPMPWTALALFVILAGTFLTAAVSASQEKQDTVSNGVRIQGIDCGGIGT